MFGCLTYSQVPKEKRTKLDPTVEKWIFVGYNDTSKAFRIYILALRRVVLTQDVKFEEEKVYRRSRELDRLQPLADQQQSSSQGTGGQGTGGTSVSVTGS